MTVTNLSLNAGVSRTVFDQSSKLSAVFKNAQNAANSTPTSAASTDSEAVTNDVINSSLPALRVQSVDVAFSATKLDVLDSGTTQVLRILGQLQSLATRANFSGLTEGERTLLDGQFQALRFSINSVPPAPQGATFSGGALVGSNGTGISEKDASATLGGFVDTNLLGQGTTTNLLTQDSAQQAINTITKSISNILEQRETIGRLQDAVDFTSASVNGALQNQEALSATFDDLETEQPSIATLLQQQPAQAANVQTARLPDNILQLLNQS